MPMSEDYWKIFVFWYFKNCSISSLLLQLKTDLLTLTFPKSALCSTEKLCTDTSLNRLRKHSYTVEN